MVAGTGSVIQRSNQLIQLKRYDDAKRCVLDGLREDPNNALYLVCYAQIEYVLKEYTHAVELTSQALYYDPALAQAYRIRALSLSNLRKNKEALVAAEEAMRLEPFAPINHIVLGDMLSLCKQMDRARALAETALASYPSDPAVHDFYARMALAYGQYEVAETHFVYALEHDPNDSRIWNNLGAARMRQGKVAEALTTYQHALEIDPHNEVTIKNLARFSARRGMFIPPKWRIPYIIGYCIFVTICIFTQQLLFLVLGLVVLFIVGRIQYSHYIHTLPVATQKGMPTIRKMARTHFFTFPTWKQIAILGCYALGLCCAVYLFFAIVNMFR